MCDRATDTSTQDETRHCSDTETRTERDGRDTTRWLDDPDVLDARLPTELRTALGRFVGETSIDTLAEWTTAVQQRTDSGGIDVAHLCHADAETAHWGELDNERYYFQCFYDAVVLAALTDRPVDIHTVSPGGEVIEARAVGSDELSVTPAEAVFSFGIERDAHERSGGDPTVQDGYAVLCPYVKAFPDRAAYERWADEVPAVTVAMPLAGATAVARALVA